MPSPGPNRTVTRPPPGPPRPARAPSRARTSWIAWSAAATPPPRKTRSADPARPARGHQRDRTYRYDVALHGRLRSQGPGPPAPRMRSYTGSGDGSGDRPGLRGGAEPGLLGRSGNVRAVTAAARDLGCWTM